MKVIAAVAMVMLLWSGVCFAFGEMDKAIWFHIGVMINIILLTGIDLRNRLKKIQDQLNAMNIKSEDTK